MKITFIQPRISYYNGGGEFYPMDAISYMSKVNPNMTFEIFTTKSGLPETERYKKFKLDAEENLSIIELSLPSRFQYIYSILAGSVRYRWDMEGFCFANVILDKIRAREIKTDLIWVYDLMDFPFKMDVPTVLHLLGYPRGSSDYRDALLSQYSALVPISRNVISKWNENLNIPIKDFAVLSQGIFLDDGNRTVRSSFSSDRVNIIFVGRLLERKGILLLCEVVRQIHGENGGRLFCLHIFGEGVLRKEIGEFIRSNSLEEVIEVHGFVNNIKDYYAEADFCVFPSLYGDGLMSVVLEALFWNGTVITTTGNGNEEAIVSSENGYLIPPNDKGALRTIITKLLENPEMVRKVKGNARRSASSFSWGNYSEKFVNICKDLINQNKFQGL